jgi:hypothetical protein
MLQIFVHYPFPNYPKLIQTHMYMWREKQKYATHSFKNSLFNAIYSLLTRVNCVNSAKTLSSISVKPEANIIPSSDQRYNGRFNVFGRWPNYISMGQTSIAFKGAEIVNIFYLH